MSFIPNQPIIDGLPISGPMVIVYCSLPRASVSGGYGPTHLS